MEVCLVNKKDRIAVIVSLIYLIFIGYLLTELSGTDVILFAIPILVYWGYRFIKNDISFIKIKE